MLSLRPVYTGEHHQAGNYPPGENLAKGNQGPGSDQQSKQDSFLSVTDTAGILWEADLPKAHAGL